MAASKDRDTKRRLGADVADPIAANVKIFAGTLYALNSSGDAVPASAVAAQRTRGVCQETVDNTGGAAGAQTVKGRVDGWFNFKNSASTDLIGRADIGNPCYVVDDETVAKTSNSSARPVAGIVRDVNASGVWIEI